MKMICDLKWIPSINFRHFKLIAVTLLMLNQNVNIVSSEIDKVQSVKFDDLFIHSSQEFSKYELIRPVVQHGRHKGEIRSTKSEEDGMHADHILVTYLLHDNEVILDLHLNYHLLPKDHFLSYQTPNGVTILKRFAKHDVDLCQYEGVVRNKVQSRVVISTCHGIKGVIHDGNDTFYIDTKPIKINDDTSENLLNDVHFLYRHSDMHKEAKATNCGHNATTDYSTRTSNDNRILRYKRSPLDTTVIRGPYNANKDSSFVELVLVVDKSMFDFMDGDLRKIHTRCRDIINVVNLLYVPLNIFVVLVGVVVWNERNQIELSSNIDITLNRFLQYRRNNLMTNHPNDYAQLLTKAHFDGKALGRGKIGTMCTFQYSGGVAMDKSKSVSVVANTIAHEMGHNFNLSHDTSDCFCQKKICIMSKYSTSVAPTHWSSCSIDQLNSSFNRGINLCLRNKPTKLFKSPQCGNGFVEPGEQCDCGSPAACKNACCNPYTCMLRSNASCATGECCDLTTCRLRTAATVCRKSEGECDLPEYCTGKSEYCPSNYFKRDTEKCNNGNAYCYQGECRSHDDQCKLLWGPSGESLEQCYTKNSGGSRHGNCGYDLVKNVHRKCSWADVKCGLLQCRYLNNSLQFGMETVAQLLHSSVNSKLSAIRCRTATFDFGLQSPNPGLTPNGAKCDINKMCVNQKCLSFEQLHEMKIGVACPDNCNGHGVCNNKGQCHCNVGYAPPFCKTSGPGGSVVSGPASNPDVSVPTTLRWSNRTQYTNRHRTRQI